MSAWWTKDESGRKVHAVRNPDQGMIGDAAKVSLNGAITAVSGAMSVYTLNANIATGSGDAALEFITDATGHKGFNVDIIDDIAIAANESLMVCWSTTVNDEANTTAALDALRTALTTPDGVGHPNCFIVTANTKQIPPILWDGTDTIKTVSVACQSTAAKAVTISAIS